MTFIAGGKTAEQEESPHLVREAMDKLRTRTLTGKEKRDYNRMWKGKFSGGEGSVKPGKEIALASASGFLSELIYGSCHPVAFNQGSLVLGLGGGELEFKQCCPLLGIAESTTISVAPRVSIAQTAVPDLESLALWIVCCARNHHPHTG
jgi:hypothetical protein